MNAVTVREAQQNLEQLIARVIDDAEPTIVVSERGEQAVLLSLEEYNSWRETLHLLASPANARRLQTAILEVQTGNVQERELLDA
ncbi:MAG: type II toxin-antitoxin system prevent-host-death family antitoxin [Chloroflexaceae bacterium]|nr:type II toxin-antitoxin system prevent-host-death family antitoxin [Chloroflexaceae bacterium]